MQDTTLEPRLDLHEHRQAKRRQALARATTLYRSIVELELERLDPEDDLDRLEEPSALRRLWTLTPETPTGYAYRIELGADGWRKLDAVDLTALLELTLRAGATLEAGDGVRITVRGIA